MNNEINILIPFLEKQRFSLNRAALIKHFYKVVLLLILLSNFIAGPVLAAEQSPEDTIEIIKAAIEAFKAVENPVTGKGTAFVDMYNRNNPMLTMKRIIDFKFKENLSRSNIFYVKEEQREGPETIWAVGKENAFSYSQHSSTIQSQPQAQFYHKIGYDFNPSTFMLYRSESLAETFETILKNATLGTLSSKIDDKGILHLSTDYRNKIIHQHTTVSVDPNMGYRLLRFFHITERFDIPERSHTDFSEIQWDKYDSSWYVKAAKQASYDGVHSLEEISSLGPDIISNSSSFKIVEFHPNVEISDSEFTLEGLNLPSGTLIIEISIKFIHTCIVMFSHLYVVFESDLRFLK